ncbi:DUF3465 domain-containing protein [Psychrobacter phenylpyruvicus]|uniref:Protein of uncharacterized function (DUF3465) n=1 Tax=Psychrobacter phenylpyruvicus TaxID=29432 RepID=A0A379LJJ7_9GAMM|nr:DUF3465 domain-containing protein [Psychrobacter phenylpyruvicus]SUD89932.1 Protein of uncharacterised function (DUF3465) [Psychrobacter phenylpyruvicus]
MRNLIPKLGLALVLSSGLILCACEPETGGTTGTVEGGSNLNNIEIDSADTSVAAGTEQRTESSLVCVNRVILEAFEQQRNSIQVKGCGQVIAVLADDNKGSRHQRFIVELADVEPKHTVLIAHNIDLAPRVDALQKGDEVVFYGQYEYNPQGGVVHWTHHDPAARHQHGWIEHKAQRFQ